MCLSLVKLRLTGMGILPLTLDYWHGNEKDTCDSHHSRMGEWRPTESRAFFLPWLVSGPSVSTHSEAQPQVSFCVHHWVQGYTQSFFFFFCKLQQLAVRSPGDSILISD